MEELKKVIESRGLKVLLEDETISILGVELNEKPMEIKVYIEPGNYQVNIGTLAVMDKIENQNLDAEDVAELLNDFAEKLKAGEISIVCLG